MKINKQSNIYTIIYIIVMVVIVGVALAWTSMALKPTQAANADADKMRQILASVRVTPQKSDIHKDYAKYITESYIVNDKGEKTEGDAFRVKVENQVRRPASERELPVFVCTLADGARKYILPAYGTGLWGPIWGYIAVDANGSTIYGAYFGHQSETPGLGANIAEPIFYNQFNPACEGSHTLDLFKDGQFQTIEVIKKGSKAPDGADYVDGVSGGTITSKAVGAMLDNCLKPYEAYLRTLQNK